MHLVEILPPKDMLPSLCLRCYYLLDVQIAPHLAKALLVDVIISGRLPHHLSVQHYPPTFMNLQHLSRLVTAL
jgi:hypothetical protein